MLETKLRQKIIRPTIKVLDEKRGLVEAVVSTETPDRDGDIVRASGWQLESFLQHPVLLSSHDYHSLQSQIGEWVSMAVRGTQLVGTARYYINQGNAEADWGFELAKQGKAAYSVGFIPDMSKATPLKGGDHLFGPYEFNGQELLEVSHVTVPANPEALQRMKGTNRDPVIADIINEMAKGEKMVSTAGKKKTDTKDLLEILEKKTEAAKVTDVIDRVRYSQDPKGGFKSFGEFLKTAWHRNYGRVNDARLKALSAEIGADGGYLIPEEFKAQLLDTALEDAIVRPRAIVIPAESDRIVLPRVLTTDLTSHDVSGIRVTWGVQSSETLNEDNPVLGRAALDMVKVTSYIESPNELVEDSGIGEFLTAVVGGAMARSEDAKFINGTGAGEPLGFLNGPATIDVTRNTTASVTQADVVAMYARLFPSSKRHSVWVCNPNTAEELWSMTVPVGTSGGGPSVLTTGGPTGMLLMGRPVFEHTAVPTMTDRGSLSLCDFRFYIIADREMLTVDSSPEFKFQQDQTSWRFRSRLNGQPWIHSAVAPENGTATLSAFVTLAA